MFPARRAYLFLQGPRSFFFQQLGQRLIDDGHRVVKVQFSVADHHYWRLGGSHAFHEPWPLLGDFIAELWQRYEITDQVAFGDCSPLHQGVLRTARRRGIRNHVFAPGYFQPYWLTLEREGVDGYSLLPRDPGWYYETGATIAHSLPGRPFDAGRPRSRLPARVMDGMVNLVDPLLFRQAYRAVDRANAVYASRMSPVSITTQASRRPASSANRDFPRQSRRLWHRCETFLQARKPFYLLSLPASQDPRLTRHSPFTDATQLLTAALASFAQFAPGRSRLAILDGEIGSRSRRRQIEALVLQHGLATRVTHLHAASLPKLIDHASGLVTVGGSDGTLALARECPTLALGNTPYRMPGLATAIAMDDFWMHPMAPDAQLFRRFSSVVMHATQINGDFHVREGRDLAVINAAHHLTASVSPLEQLLCDSRLLVAS
ncbi:capsular polysaccharide export protein, LipB/KpsS family [Salinicola rhizosphaerae]|uniref:Capsular polysaccharide export protein n=1 Tax=Salinicola rhizosphaerae TaxID=1443141 RepID=A0ABQ3DSJ2_9GAMM|nr:capsule biosynthesis protein CapA [Salinicola rhizosphaerae]GHB11242.1 capsular polysaccharide export protein [Salinicola rhizosphaerae]